MPDPCSIMGMRSTVVLPEHCETLDSPEVTKALSSCSATSACCMGTEEVFSSLMVPDPAVKKTLGGGGVAAISPSRTDIHVTVMFNGIFAPTEPGGGRRITLVKLSRLAGKTSESAMVASSEITLPKIHVSLNTASVKLTLPPEQQPLLVAGKLSMRLTSPDGRRHIEGPVIVRPTCNIFQAVLTAETSNSGFAVLNVNQDGSVSYQAYASGMNSAPMVVVLETDSPADSEVRTMAASYNPPFAYHWTNGTFTHGTSQVLEMLLTDDLTFKVLSEGQSELRGRVKQRLYSDAFLSGESLCNHLTCSFAPGGSQPETVAHTNLEPEEGQDAFPYI
ncbi:dorsal-ventral patterning protein Sog-like [Dermacentor variabilis]|uniref:dorsal-ventral patterning protein Sog-like n=1 Tax=Dermacentor variabilis TaxID=34621 RepID=UPI003F5C002B